MAIYTLFTLTTWPCMSSWKILITDGLHTAGQAILRAHAEVADLKGISRVDLLGEIAGYDALIVRSRTVIDAHIITKPSRLRVIGRAGVGVDNIDLISAEQQGILVVNAPSATSRAVAEYTLALLFTLARSIPQANASTKAGKWQKNELVGVELYGKVLGIIGVGNIGSLVSRTAAGLGMQVIGHDPFLSDELISKRGAKPVPLSELYRSADFISLHTPFVESAHALINRHTLEEMKTGICIVNTARGGLVDETALFEALESGKVSGAALDVYAEEPPRNSALVAHPRVIATPHIAAQTREAQERTAVDIAQEVLAALRGAQLRWRVV